ncbi:hypothetical protein [Microbispora sp. H13382]|uniref:hypothetical protein n=1 Tax=Microbispora sp. H13382 TaxID=2729112 RepID=UPI00160358FA|nr:hypothetical protein [Microbispora sp. H13382]
MTDDVAADPPCSFADRSRRWRLGLVALGGLWELLTLPLVAWDGWSWEWVAHVYRSAPYQAVSEAIGADPYVVFGALGGLSFLAVGVALLPDMRRAGIGGRLFAWLIIATGVVSALSYLGTPVDSPLHPLWGAEIFALILVGIAGPFAAATAGTCWKRWTRILMAATILVLAAGLASLGYYPHGPLVSLAAGTALLIAHAPRDAALRSELGQGSAAAQPRG